MSAGRKRQTLAFHLALASSSSVAAFSAVIAISIFLPLGASLSRADLDRAAVATLADHFLFLHESFWPVVGVSLIASTLSALWAYRRMTAPLVRVCRAFAAIEDNRVPSPLEIRATDYLGDEVAALNRALSALARRAADTEQLLALVDATCDSIASREPALGPKLDELREAAARLRC